MLLRICQSLVLHCLVVLHFWHGCLFISATVPIKENILSNASTAQGHSVMSCSMINLVYINNNCYHGVITNCNCCTSGHNREVINLVVTLTLCHCVWYIIIKTLFNFNICIVYVLMLFCNFIIIPMAALYAKVVLWFIGQQQNQSSFFNVQDILMSKEQK